MKKTLKLLLVCALVLVSVFALTACGGTSVVGEWKATEYTITDNGQEFDYIEEGAVVELKLEEKDNKAIMTLTPPASTQQQPQVSNGTWKEKDGKVTVTINNSDTTFEVKDGKLVADFTTNGVTYHMIMEKK